MRKFYRFSNSVRSAMMRCLLIAAAALSVSNAAVHAQPQQPPKERIDISFRNVPLEQILLYLQNESGYYVLFNSDEVKRVSGVSVDMKNATVQSILDRALANTGLDYTIDNDTIVIKMNWVDMTPDEVIELPRLNSISGVVVNADTEMPIAGATVVVEGTRYGTSTDVDGIFSMGYNPNEGNVMVITHLGMNPFRTNINGTNFLRVEMTESVQNIDDIVVTGYADISAKKSPGNMTVIQGEDIVRVSPTSVIGALNTFEPSFRIKENLSAGSNPNVIPEFSLRGETAFSGELTSDISRQSLLSNKNLPIFILDGFETTVDRIYDMDPHRIQKLTILKDASAAALYGSRAANGVILVETKAPRAGRLNVDYFATVSLNTPDLRWFDLMNSREKLQAELAGGYYQYGPENPEVLHLNTYRNYLNKLSEVNRGVDTDWLAQGVRNVVNHRHDLSIYGGEKKVRWSTNLNYNSGDGVMKGSKRSTYSGELKLHVTLGKFIISNAVYYGGQRGSESPFGNFSDYSHKQPYDVIRDENTGRYIQQLKSFERSDNQLLNPLYESEYYNSYNNSKYDNFSDQLQLRWDITPKFHIVGSLKLEKQYQENRKFIDPNSSTFRNVTDPTQLGSLDVTTFERSETEGKLQVSYNNQIGKHNFVITGNGSIRELRGTQLTSQYTGFNSGAVSSINSAARLVGNKPSNRNEIQRMATVNLYGSYSYNEIYIVDLQGALDANAEFGTDNKVAPFWSVAGSIHFHNYGFFKSKVINRLVLRGSYGLVGRVPTTQSAAINVYENISQDDWYVTGSGSVLAGMGNSDLRWEQTYSGDVSAEIEMLDNRIYAKLGYYNKITNGLLTQLGIPSSSGFKYYWGNMGKLKNEGVELDFHVVPYRDRNWNIILGGKIRHNRNIMMELSEAAQAYNDLVDNFYDGYGQGKNSLNPEYGRPFKKFFEGGSTTAISAVQSLGINPGTGKELFMRPDGSISYEWRPQDAIIAGDTEPKVSGSINLGVQWKQFDLMTTFYFETGGQAYNTTLMQYVENVNLIQSNADRRVNLMRWQTQGDVAPLKDIADREQITRATTRFVQKNNIFQHTSLDLGYTFKHELVQRWRLSNVRLSLNTGELFYLSCIRRERGTDYPYARTYSFKVQVSF